MATLNSALYCSTCDIRVPTISHMTGHLQGTRHIAALSRTPVVVCPSCDARITSPDMWESHVQGKRHRRNTKPTGIGGSGDIVQLTYQSLLDSARRPPSIAQPTYRPLLDSARRPPSIAQSTYRPVLDSAIHPPDPGSSGDRRCDVCHITFERWEVHAATPGHLNQVQLYAGSTAGRLDRAINSVTVTPPIKVDFGFFEAQESGAGSSFKLINITATAPGIKFIGATISSDMPPETAKNFAISFAPVEQMLPEGGKGTLVIQFKPRNRWGWIQEQIELNFLDSSTNREFTISRFLEVDVGGENDLWIETPCDPEAGDA